MFTVFNYEVRLMKHSNCMIEAIRAKIRDPKMRIIFISPFKNECFCPHFMWTDGVKLYDYHGRNVRHWWQEFWFEGYIRERPYAAYLRWRKTRRWR